MTMPGSFNEEFGDDEQTGPARAAAQQIVFRQPPPVVVVPPDPMLEVQRRLDMAACYQVLVAENLFEQDTAASKLVQEEIRTFIYSRLQALVNIGAPAAPQGGTSEFNVDEVRALKALARSLLSRKTEQAPDTRKEEPVKPPISKGKKKKAEAPPPPPPPAVKSAPPRLRARKTQAPPSFMGTAIPPPAAVAGSAAPATPAAPAAPAAKPPTGKRVGKIRVMNDKGEIYEKEVVLSDARQARPVRFQPVPPPTNQHEQNVANNVAEMEAEQNAQGFVTNVERAPTLPITRR